MAEPPSPELLLAVAALALGPMALFSALETAVLASRRSRLEPVGRRGERPIAIIESPETFQAASLVGKSLCEAVAYAAAALAGWVNPGGLAGVVGLELVAFLMVVLLGQTLPKVIASRSPENVLIALWPIARVLPVLLAPPVWAVRTLGRALAGPRGHEGSAARAVHSEEEIKLLLEDSAEEGVIEAEEKEMIHSIIEFTDTVVRQVMVPRTDISCVSVDAPIEEAVQCALDSGHSRLPVFEGTLDRIVGVVHVKDILPRLVRTGDRGVVRDLLRKPFFVPEGKKLDVLLQEFRTYKTQLAIVVDEFGGTSGLVTMEDVVEEIVGEIEDEYDPPELPEFERTEDGARVDARMNIADLNEQLDLELPNGEWDTVGGLVLDLFGRPPLAGEEVQHGALRVRVEAVDGVRIRRVRIIREPEPLMAD